MEIKEFFSLIKMRRQTVVKIVLLALLLVLAVTFVQPLKYRASSKLLLTQDSMAGTDAYSISKSNQFLTNTLAQVVYSNSFFEQVMASGFNIEAGQFSDNQNKKMKQWNNMVSARPVSDTGMIVINVYHQDKYQADQINQAITFVLKTRHSLYHGLGNKVSIKIIDKSTLSNWPVKPNIPVNIFVGLFLGIILGSAFVYVFPDSDLRLWPKKKNKENLSDLRQQLENVDNFYDNNYRDVEELLAEKSKEKLSTEEPSFFKENEFIPQDNGGNDFNGNIKNVI